MNHVPQHRRLAAGGQAGFSLLEALVSATVGLMLMAGVVSMSSVQLNTMQDQTKQADLQGVGRNIMNLFQREVRRAGADPQCSGNVDPIASASKWHIVLESDLDGSGAIDSDGEHVAYYYLYEWGGIYRYADNRFEALVTGLDLDGSRLRYFDSNGVEIDSDDWMSSEERSAIRQIRLELELESSGATGSTESELNASLAADITLRNRFFMADTDCETPPDNVVLTPDPNIPII